MDYSNIFRWATLIVWSLWLILYWDAGVGLASNLIRSFKATIYFYDRYFIIGLVVLSNIILWTGYLILRKHILDPLPEPKMGVIMAGITMVIIGALGTFWRRQQMQAPWSAHTHVLPDQRLIDDGKAWGSKDEV